MLLQLRVTDASGIVCPSQLRGIFLSGPKRNDEALESQRCERTKWISVTGTSALNPLRQHRRSNILKEAGGGKKMCLWGIGEAEEP